VGLSFLVFCSLFVCGGSVSIDSLSVGGYPSLRSIMLYVELG